MSSIIGPQSSSPLPSESGELSKGLTAEEKIRPFYSMLKVFFPQEPDTSISSLTETECNCVINWVFGKGGFSEFFGKKVVKHFDSLKPGDLRQQFDRILADKKIELEKIDSQEKIKEIVFMVFWHSAKDEIKHCLNEDELKKEVGAELNIPPHSTIIKKVFDNFANQVEEDACRQIASWCLCDKIDAIEKIFKDKVRIKLDLSLRDIYLKDMLVVDEEY